MQYPGVELVSRTGGIAIRQRYVFPLPTCQQENQRDHCYVSSSKLTYSSPAFILCIYMYSYMCLHSRAGMQEHAMHFDMHLYLCTFFTSFGRCPLGNEAWTGNDTCEKLTTDIFPGSHVTSCYSSLSSHGSSWN